MLTVPRISLKESLIELKHSNMGENLYTWYKYQESLQNKRLNVLICSNRKSLPGNSTVPGISFPKE